MPSESELLALLETAESQYLERKESCPKRAELRETICAFANSTPENEVSVLFIGVADKGAIKGVASADMDSIQKTVLEVGRNDCYPPIQVVTQVVRKDGKQIIAVIVEHSKETPHFTGHSYIRVGPTSRKADSQQFDELISIRNDKVRRILSARKNGLISVQWTNGPTVVGAYGARPTKWQNLNQRDYLIVACDSFILQLIESPTGNNIHASVKDVVIEHDSAKHRMKLRMDFKYLVNR